LSGDNPGIMKEGFMLSIKKACSKVNNDYEDNSIGYTIDQLNKVNVHNSDYKRSIKLYSTNGQTNNLSISEAQFIAIKAILIHIK
jgi:hypothetical protein